MRLQSGPSNVREAVISDGDDPRFVRIPHPYLYRFWRNAE
ncbi:hypothetical protein CPL00368_CDS0075 [Klebsiella phage DevonBitter]